MAKLIQIKRGLEANRTGITPAAGELIWTTDNKDLWVGDGSTAGGIKATANIEANYIANTAKGAANGVATLDANGLVPTNQMSPLALTDVFTAASETAQLGLTAQEGDVCVRTDENKSYIHNGGTAGDMTDWQELLTPTDAVTSVNGQTGVVSLDTDDIGEGSTNLYYTDTRVDSYIKGTTILTDISDVDSGATNNQILAWDNANSKWSPVDAGSVTATTLVSLSDTPSAYAAGDAGKFLRVNAAEDAVEFSTADTDDISEGTTNLYYTDARADARIAAASIDDLSDVDTSTTAPASDDYLKFDGTNWVPSAPQTIAIDDLSDVDTTTTAPTSGQTLKWDGTNWVPSADNSSVASLDDIGDVNVTGVTDGQYISWDNTASEWQAVDLPTGVDGTFTGLTDTPNAYASGDAGKFLKVNSAEDAVEFATAGINELSDVDTATSAPTNGQVLKWDNANSLWAPANDTDTTYTAGTGISLTGTTFALNASIDDLTDVDTTTTAPSTDDILGWNGTNWVPGANVDGGTF